MYKGRNCIFQFVRSEGTKRLVVLGKAKSSQENLHNKGLMPLNQSCATHVEMGFVSNPMARPLFQTTQHELGS